MSLANTNVSPRPGLMSTFQPSLNKGGDKDLIKEEILPSKAKHVSTNLYVSGCDWDQWV
jgi:hypothetical protein